MLYGSQTTSTSNYEIGKPLPKEKSKNVVGLMKDVLDGQIMKKIVGLRAKTCSCLKGNNDKGKKTKGTKNCVRKRKLIYKRLKKMFKSISNVKYNKLLRKEKNCCKFC